MRLPSVDSDDPKSITVTTDVEAVRDELLSPLLDSGRNVVVVGHSAGAFLASGVVHGVCRAHRKDSGAVVGLIVVAGFPATELALSVQAARDKPNFEHTPWVDPRVRVESV
jgi:pimeloyl-ACP methyl ester carboxylesterase